MVVMDGNNSLKRLARLGDRTPSDARVFDNSDYFLSASYVDRFADEVQSRKVDNIDHKPEADMDEEETEEHSADVCPANRWKAAGEKGTWGIFEESGIFAGACRHGFILWITDMIRSGEL
jgi:Kyakuja-Dileera-Zisupton transposase